MYWYEKALVNLAGLSRTKALKRIEMVSARVTGTNPDGPSGPVGELKKFEGHSDEVKGVALSHDGRYGVSGSIDQTVRVWDLATGKEEKLLRGHHPSLERYAAALKQRAHGRGLRALRRLLEMKRTYPAGPFLAAVEQALQFGLFDLARLETLILRQVAGDFFNLDAAEDDDA